MAWVATLGRPVAEKLLKKRKTTKVPEDALPAFSSWLRITLTFGHLTQHYLTLGHRFQPPPKVALTMVTLGDLQSISWYLLLPSLILQASPLCLLPPHHSWQSLVHQAGFRSCGLWPWQAWRLLTQLPLLLVAGDQVTTIHPSASNSTRWPWAMTDMNQKKKTSSLHRVLTGEKKKSCHTTFSYLNTETNHNQNTHKRIFLLKNCLLGNSLAV